ncbi:MAG: CpsD/CapB family tyrosine-protein kinase [Candidatus Nitrosoglobus sp.]|jgi:capsular exopolysaccharide synthesis family protein
MAKIYEALKQAEKEYKAGVRSITPPDPFIVSESEIFSNNIQAGVEPYANLKANLFTQYPEEKIQIIMFIGLTSKAGVTTTVANFAHVLAQDTEAKILLVDANAENRALGKLFNTTHISDLPIATGAIPSITKVIRSQNLYLSSCGKGKENGSAVFDSRELNQILEVAREQFNYVLFDMPPVKCLSEIFSICSQADGIVFVIEAGKTRRQVAAAVKEQFEKVGARVLGFVLNRKKYYIPEFIYKRLF